MQASSDATIIDTMCAIEVGTIYFPIHQVRTAAVKDTPDLLIEHRKLTLPLHPWKIISLRGKAFFLPGRGAFWESVEDFQTDPQWIVIFLKWPP